jgi:hypothetical protein
MDISCRSGRWAFWSRAVNRLILAIRKKRASCGMTCSDAGVSRGTVGEGVAGELPRKTDRSTHPLCPPVLVERADNRVQWLTEGKRPMGSRRLGGHATLTRRASPGEAGSRSMGVWRGRVNGGVRAG